MRSIFSLNTTAVARTIIVKHQIQPEYGDEQADAGRDG